MIYSDRVSDAFSFALQLHRHQERKGSTIPYITHLMAVASIVGEFGGDEDLVIAGLLHDAVEDQGGLETLEKIRARFGDQVARVVKGCSDTDETPKPAWQERKEAYIAHLSEAGPDTLLVSASDKLHNARAIASDLRQVGETLWQRFKGGKDGSLWYYRALTDAYLRLGPDRLAQELDLVVTEIEELASA
jgi:GTP pyrophosphokinase